MSMLFFVCFGFPCLLGISKSGDIFLCDSSLWNLLSIVTSHVSCPSISSLSLSPFFSYLSRERERKFKSFLLNVVNFVFFFAEDHIFLFRKNKQIVC